MSAPEKRKPGRPCVLDKPQERKVRLEARQVDTVQKWAEQRRVSWSAALRQMIDAVGQTLKIKKG